MIEVCVGTLKLMFQPLHIRLGKGLKIKKRESMVFDHTPLTLPLTLTMVFLLRIPPPQPPTPSPPIFLCKYDLNLSKLILSKKLNSKC